MLKKKIGFFNVFVDGELIWKVKAVNEQHAVDKFAIEFQIVSNFEQWVNKTVSAYSAGECEEMLT